MKRSTRLLGWFVLGAAGTALLAIVLFVLLQAAQTTHAIRQQQQNNATTLSTTQRAAQSSARTARLVKSCVDPHGRCFKDSQKRTGEVVGSINRSVIAAAACASTLAPLYAHDGQQVLTDRITACVVAQLADRKR